MSGVIVDVNAKTSKAEKQLANVEKAVSNIDKTTSKTSESMRGLVKSIGALAAGGFAINYLKNVSTEFTSLNNKIATVTGRSKDLLTTQEQLFKMAERTRGSLSGTVQVFSSFGRALKSTGTPLDKILKVTESIQKAVAIDDMGAQSAAAAIIQLGQGISSGTLRGQELNSVLEQAPRIAKAIADEIGVTTGKLRGLAAEGKLTSDVVFKSLLNQSRTINSEFGQLAPSLAQAKTSLSDSIKIYVSELDKGLGLTTAMGLRTFSLSKAIRQASRDAFELGTRIAYYYHQTLGGIKSIAKPMFGIVSALGKQFLKVLPRGVLTRTLKDDIRDALTILDRSTGSYFEKFKNFNPFAKLSFKSDVEKALDDLKSLNPKNWTGAGWNKLTLERFFSRKNLQEYAAGLKRLAIAVSKNYNTLGSQITEFVINAEFGWRRVKDYFNFDSAKIFTFKRGHLENFLKSINELAKGISGLTVKIYQVGRIISNTFLPEVYNIAGTVKELFLMLPTIVAKSLTVIINYVGGASKSLAETFSDFVNVFMVLQTPLVDLFKTVRRIFNKIAKLIRADKIIDALKEFRERVQEELGKLFDGILDKSPFTKALQHIRSFGKKVIEVFFNIYDAVIGHSWWTDTVETVVSTSKGLWDKAKGGLNTFAKGTITVFQGLFNRVKNFDIDVPEFTKFKIVINEFKLPKIKGSSFMDAFISIKESMTQLFKDLFEAFPSLMKGASAAIGAVLVQLLFPANIIKKYILAALVTSFATSGTIVAEQFGAAFTGGSLMYAVGNKIGTIVGTAMRVAAREIPIILRDLGKGVTGFFRGFIEQFPKISNAIRGLFDFTDQLNLSGPLGILGAILLGSMGMDLFNVFKKGQKEIGSLGKVFKNMSGLIRGKNGGMISRFIFGRLGPTRTIGLLGLAIDQMGMLDSLFQDMPVLNYGAKAGILAALWHGDELSGKIVGTIKSKVFKPLSRELKYFISSNKKLNWLNAIVYGGAGAANSALSNTFGKRLKTALAKAWNSAADWTADLIRPAWNTTHSYLDRILFGTDAKSTIQSIKSRIGEMVSWVKITFKKNFGKRQAANIASVFTGVGGFAPKDTRSFYEKYLKPDKSAKINPLFNNFAGMFGGGGSAASATSKATRSLSDIAAKAKNQLRSVNTYAMKLAGSQGLLGRLFLGKFGKVAIITTILALMAGIASAQESSDMSFKDDSSPMDDLATTWNKIKLENPFLKVTTIIIGTTLVSLMGALIKFRSQARMLFSNLIDPSTIKKGFAAISAYFGGSGAMFMRRAGIAAGAYLVGGVASRVAQGKDEFDASAGLMLAGLTTLLPKGIVSVITKAIGSVFSAITSTTGLIVTAIVAAVGAAGVLLFGPKGKFWETIGDGFKWVWQHTLGSVPKELGKSGISKALEDLAKKNQLKLTFDVSGIDFDEISSKEKKKLKEMLKEFSDTVESADFQKITTGEISSDTHKSIEDLNRALDRYTKHLEVKSGDKIENFGEYLESLKFFKEPGTWVDTAVSWSKQKMLDRSYAWNKWLLSLRKTLNQIAGRDNSDTFKDMKRLEELRDTKYNIRYKGPVSPKLDYLIDLEKQSKSLLYTNDQLQIATEELQKKFKKAAEAVGTRESRWLITFTGGFQRGLTKLPDSNPLAQAYNKLLDKLIKANEAQIKFNRESKNISKFQKRVSNLQNSLKDIGMTLDTSSLFANDEESLLRLEHLSKSATRIFKDMAQADNVRDLNRYANALAGIKVEIESIINTAKTNNNSRKQFKLKSLAESIGINWASDRSFRGLGDEVAEQLFAEMTKIQTASELLQTKFPSTLSNIGTTYDKAHKELLENLAPSDRDRLFFLRRVSVDQKSFMENLSALFNGEENRYTKMMGISPAQSRQFVTRLMSQMAPTERDYLMQYAKIERDKKNIDQKILKLFNDTNQVLLSNDLAGMAGVDLSQVVRSKGFDRSLSLLKDFKEVQDKIYQAELSGNTSGIESLYKRLYNIREALSETPTDLQTFISNISSLGINISLEDIAAMDKSSLNNLVEANTLVKDINKSMSQTDEVVSKAEFDQILTNKIKAARLAFKSFFNNLGKTISSQFQLLKDAGFSDNKKLLAIPKEMRTQIIDAQKSVIYLNHLIESGDKTKPFEQIVAELDEAETILNRMQKIFDTFAGKLDSINQAFSLNLSKEEFAMLPEELQIQLADSARTMLDKLDGTLTKYLGTNLTKDKSDQNSAKDKSDQNSAKDKSDQNSAKSSDVNFSKPLNDAMNVFKEQREASFATQLQYLQSGVSAILAKDSFSTMKTSEVVDTITGVVPKLSEMKEQLQQLSLVDLQQLYNAALDIQQERKLQDVGAGNKTAKQVADDMQRLIENALIAVSKKDFGAKTKFALNDIGINIEDSAFNMIDMAGRSKIAGLLKTIEEQTAIMQAEGASPQEKRAAQSLVNTAKRHLEDEIERSSKDPKLSRLESIKQAGIEMATSVHSGLTSAFQGLLKGENDIGDFVANIASTLTNSIIDTFINGMLDPLTGENGKLTESLQSFGSSLYENVSGVFKGMFDGISDTLTQNDGLGSKVFSFFSGIVTGIGDALMSAGSGLSGFFGTAMTFVSGLFGNSVAAATGGYITGPGTGTSDSIYARLSNGEYVINAKQTKKHRRLLENINRGLIPHFATGGPVTGINSTLPMRNDAKPTKRKVKDTPQQVINLNITGDVSRQTRAEVFRMLPSIANGVNAHNKETGYKG